MVFGALGDVHGDFAAVHRVIAAHADVPFWVAVGDLADTREGCEPTAVPVYWIKGNNEDFDFIATLRGPDYEGPAGLHHLPNGTVTTIHGIRVAALGGTFAPTWFETAPGDLPFPAPERRRAHGPSTADKRRHYVRAEIEALRQAGACDLLLTHEAPSPYFVRRPGSRGMDAGKRTITELVASLRPRLHLFGHHHRFAEMRVEGVPSVGLDRIADSYLLIDARTFEYERRPTPA